MSGLGIGLALLAAVANAWAVVLQAAEDRRSSDRDAMRASLLVAMSHRPRWLAGTGLMALGGVAQVAAMAFAPIAVVQPALASSQLVLLAIARVRLGERVGPNEILGAAAITVGLVAVVVVAPPDTSTEPGAARLAVPLAVVGALTLGGFLAGRARPRAGLVVVIGAGLAYAWVDFASKLLSLTISAGAVWQVIVWIALMVCVGAVAFVEETTAMQRRPAVTVAPVIGAIKVPLPVLMALWAGMESWNAGPIGIGVLLAGLAVAALGAALLGRSQAVANLGGAAPATERS
jgi:drug/metabolite transporter (DMT)-like permease